MIENTITEVDSVVYLERLEQLIFTDKKVLASWPTRLCFRRFQMRAWSNLNRQDFSKWFYSGLRWLLDKFHSVFKLSGKEERETVTDLECFINF